MRATTVKGDFEICIYSFLIISLQTKANECGKTWWTFGWTKNP